MAKQFAQLALKRVYEPASAEDGQRVLVDRLWPRGLTRERAHLDLWLKQVAPSAELRKWFHHEERNWDEFRHRYLVELDGNDAVNELRARIDAGKVTLLYGAHDEEHNHAVVLRDFLKSKGR